jgi:hypothetical protein
MIGRTARFFAAWKHEVAPIRYGDEQPRPAMVVATSEA